MGAYKWPDSWLACSLPPELYSLRNACPYRRDGPHIPSPNVARRVCLTRIVTRWLEQERCPHWGRAYRIPFCFSLLMTSIVPVFHHLRGKLLCTAPIPIGKLDESLRNAKPPASADTRVSATYPKRRNQTDPLGPPSTWRPTFLPRTQKVKQAKVVPFSECIVSPVLVGLLRCAELKKQGGCFITQSGAWSAISIHATYTWSALFVVVGLVQKRMTL
ncbi:hypothetical protein EDD16DRAFT_246117 [Pisolithus croceorrhizus]|nr:hypothetical protein EDD16DRAFT_246117 [Pisolithus croceorrhizus]